MIYGADIMCRFHDIHIYMLDWLLSGFRNNYHDGDRIAARYCGVYGCIVFIICSNVHQGVKRSGSHLSKIPASQGDMDSVACVFQYYIMKLNIVRTVSVISTI